MYKVKLKSLSFLLSCMLLMSSVLSFFTAPDVSAAPHVPSELDRFYDQAWVPEHYATDDNEAGPIKTGEFIELLNTAIVAAGSDHKISPTQTVTYVSRELAAQLLDQIVDVPFVTKTDLSDVPKDSPYTSSIHVIQTSGLIKGIAPKLYGYGKPITRSDAAVIAYRLFLYEQPFSPVEASIEDIQNALSSGRLTSKELVELYLDRIEKYDKQGPSINSIIHINEKATSVAKELDAERKAKGPRGPLHGIPVIVKDNFDTSDMPTTGGSIALKDNIPPDDAYQVKKLREAGAIILAKANLHEFAFGYSTVSSMGGQTLNPYNLAKIPGGSSGGTGAAIAASFAAVGMGSDTGGSIRIPSAFNNLVGIRPTIGLSSRDGIMPLALTQDTGGPLARTVKDAAIILDATAGYDPNDVTTASGIGRLPESYLDNLDSDGLRGARIGILREVFGDNKEINAVMTQAIKEMKDAGATLVDDLSLPNFAEINSYGSLSAWEFKFQFNDYLESTGVNRPYKTLSDIIATGLFDPSIENSLKERNNRVSLKEEEYKDIVLYRTKLAQEGVLKLMADHNLDAIIFPTSANPIVNIGENQTVGNGFKLSSFTGYPTVTVPAGFTPDHLPVGMDFIGRPFSEPTLLKFAYSYEQSTHHRQAPALTP